MVEASAIYDEDKNTRAQDRKLPVIEVFGPTIQGEGAMIGVKTMFVRMGGCDFRCAKCDSLHAVIPAAVKKNKTMMTQEEIGALLHKARQETGVEWVTISGGNPAIWDLTYLVQICQAMGMKVAVETQATVWHDWIAHCDQITLSPKSPGMGEKFKPEVFIDFLARLHYRQPLTGITLLPNTSLKIVCFDQLDMDFAWGVGELFVRQGGSVEQLYLSVGNPHPPILDEDLNLVDNPEDPVYKRKPYTEEMERDLPSVLIESYRQMLEDFLQDPRFVSWKFLPQLHVLLWSNKAGV